MGGASALDVDPGSIADLTKYIRMWTLSSVEIGQRTPHSAAYFQIPIVMLMRHQVGWGGKRNAGVATTSIWLDRDLRDRPAHVSVGRRRAVRNASRRSFYGHLPQRGIGAR